MFGFNPQPSQQNQPQINIIPQNQSQNQRNTEEEFKNITSRINNQLKSFEFENPKGIIKQSLKNTLGLNFSNFNNTYSRNIHNFGVDKIYILSHNLRSNLEKNKIPQANFDFSKINAQKFEQISNNILSREKDIYKQFIEVNGDIGLNDLNNINNITKELKKINANNPFNYMQENPDFDFDNNKLGIYLLLQQNGKSGKIFENGGNNKDNKDNGLKTKNKRCNEHMRRRMIKNKEKYQDKLNKFNNFNNIYDIKNIKNSVISMGRPTFSATSGKERFSDDNRNNLNISLLKPRKNYLIEEERDLFEKYFNSLIPFFRELISEKNININDKILKLKEVIDINISTFREGRRNFNEFIKALITPTNNENNEININFKLTTKTLIQRIIKYLEKDCVRNNYHQSQTNSFQKKEDFITNYSNNIIYSHFSTLISQSQSKTLILWTKIFFFIRFGWKKECIEYINSIEGRYISESGLREIKDSLDDNKRINLQNYNEFKRILNQEKKEENPFKHACMVYMTKIADQLCKFVLIEINDYLWFNLNLIFPSDNYSHLIQKNKDENINNNIDNSNNRIFEIDTSINNNNNGEGIIKLMKLKDLQNFFENINTQDIITSNEKNTYFVYIILLSGLLKFKDALLFMIKNKMYEDAINYFFFLKQIGIYNNFEEINEINIINIPKKKLNVNKTREEIYQIFPSVSNNIPALMLYIIFSDNNNFIQPLANLLLETEAFYILNNYYQKVLLFQEKDKKIKDKDKKKEKNIINYIDNYNNFNLSLMEIIDENNLIKLCKTIFELLLTHKLKDNSNLNPLFNTFKDLKMLTELTGILINKSIELLNLKKPIITIDNNGQYMINLNDRNNQKYFGYSLVMNYFGALINDVNQLNIEKQNERENLARANQLNENNEKIFLLSREIEDNQIPISLLKQLPIIENIYENIFKYEFVDAFRLFMENIYLVKIGFDSNESEYLGEFNSFINEGLKKLKYGLLGLYPDILYLFVWVTKIVLNDFYKKGDRNIIMNMKDKCKALEYLLDRLVEISKNDKDLMKYAEMFQKTQIEVNQIQQFYQQNNSII